jgi:hypothetical protein
VGADNVRTLCRLAVAVTGIIVEVDLRGLSFNGQIVRVLASFSLLADTCLEVGAEDGLRVLTLLECLLLNGRDRLEERLNKGLLLLLLLLLLLCLELFSEALVLATPLVPCHYLGFYLVHVPMEKVRDLVLRKFKN